MSWIYEAPVPHVCDRPEKDSLSEVKAVGSVWECQECGLAYRVSDTQLKQLPADDGASMVSMAFYSWMAITPEEAQASSVED